MSFSALETSRHLGRPVHLYQFKGTPDVEGEGMIGPYGFTNGEDLITRDGIDYQPWPIKHGNLTVSGTLDKAALEVSMGRDSVLDDMFLAFPPSQVINLIIFRGHMGDDPTPTNFPAEWSGRVRGVDFADYEVKFNCEPVSTSIRRPGLRRNYQLGCPHVLYGEMCRASKSAATDTQTVASVAGNTVVLVDALGFAPANFTGGLLEWTRADGIKEIRTILSVTSDGKTVRLRGATRDLLSGGAVAASMGCSRTLEFCTTVHNNVHNFGGQPWIPFDNPLASVSKFY